MTEQQAGEIIRLLEAIRLSVGKTSIILAASLSEVQAKAVAPYILGLDGK